jgi:hypothetical protein
MGNESGATGPTSNAGNGNRWVAVDRGANTPNPIEAPAEADPPRRRLAATHPHLVYATARLGPLPNRLYQGIDWQYEGSVDLEAGYRHTFRHPRHPFTDRSEVRTVDTSVDEVASAQRRITPKESA